jgi:hypothetical protein
MARELCFDGREGGWWSMDGRDLVLRGRSVGWWFTLSDWLRDASQEDCPCQIPSFFFISIQASVHHFIDSSLFASS